MDYYTGNGVYDYLIECDEREKFYWTSGNIWMLVYGDEQYDPRVLTVVSENLLRIPLTQEESEAIRTAKYITENTDVPIAFVRFEAEKSIENVLFWENDMKSMEHISSDELRRRFAQFGLKVNEASSHKSINDKSSSPYHDWQRENMGDAIVVADIDLVRREGNKPVEVIELKRSYIELENWEPFRKDYKNFILISKLARKRGIEFYIVYNKRIKTPFYDDVSRLKIFEFDHRMQSYCKLLKYASIKQFVEKPTKEN